MRLPDDVVALLGETAVLLARIAPEDPEVQGLLARIASIRATDQGTRMAAARGRSMPIGRGYAIDLLVDQQGSLSGTHDHGDLVPLSVEDLGGVQVATCIFCDLLLTLVRHLPDSRP